MEEKSERKLKMCFFFSLEGFGILDDTYTDSDKGYRSESQAKTTMKGSLLVKSCKNIGVRHH